MQNNLLTEQQVSRYIGLSVSWLRKSRSEKNPEAPPYIKVGKAVRYSLKSIDRWLESKAVGGPKLKQE